LLTLGFIASTSAFGGGGGFTTNFWKLTGTVLSPADDNYSLSVGDMVVTGNVTGALNMDGDVITNIGNAGTDFNANGGLTLAEKLYTDEVRARSSAGLKLYDDGGNGIFVKDGELSLHGTARVKKSLWLPFNALKAPGTKPATFVDHGISGAWEFSDGTDDTLVFNIQTPVDMDKTVAPIMLIGWSTNTTVTSETCTWQLEYLWTSEGEDTTAAAQGTLTVDSNAISQANGLIMAEITGIDLPSETDVCIHCRLKRLGAGGNDDLTDTSELHGICFKYTSNKLGE